MRRLTTSGVALIVLATAAPLCAAPFAYVANRGSDDVSVIDTASHTVVQTIAVGAGPTSVAIDAADTRVYVVNSDDDSVSVIDSATNTVITTVSVCGSFHLIGATGVALSPDGTTAYVGCGFGAAISAIDTTTFATLQSTIGMSYDFVQGVAVDVTGARIYAQLRDDFGGSARLVAIDDASLSVVALRFMPSDVFASISLPLGPAASTSGTRIYAPHPGGNMLRIYDPTSELVRTVPLPSSSYGVAVNQAGTLVYVTLGNGSVAVVDAVGETLITTIPVGTSPRGLSLSADEHTLYVANAGDDSVSVVDTATNTVVTSIPVGDRPISMGRFIARPPRCGDGVVGDDELCDAGDLNGTDASCCAADCTPARSGLPCADDANACTSNICDAVGTCHHQPQAGSCDDGFFCNGADTCVDGACSTHAGDPCSGGPQCNDRCNEQMNDCVSPRGTRCDRGLGIQCGNPDTCANGVCTDQGGGDADGDLVCTYSDNCPNVPNPLQANADDDNFGNPCDPCFNLTKGRTFLDQPNPTLTIWKSRSTLPEEAFDTVRLTADFRLPATATFAALPLLSDGARIVFIDDVYKFVLDAALPGGALEGGRGTRGWRLGSGGKRWLYRDRTSAPIGGIRSIALIDRSAVSPGLVRVRMRGASHTFYSGELAEDVVIVLGGSQAAGAGWCGESAYQYPFDCQFDDAFRRWTCRRRL